MRIKFNAEDVIKYMFRYRNDSDITTDCKRCKYMIMCNADGKLYNSIRDKRTGRVVFEAYAKLDETVYSDFMDKSGAVIINTAKEAEKFLDNFDKWEEAKPNEIYVVANYLLEQVEAFFVDM